MATSAANVRLRPSVVVFDVVETLANLDPVQTRLAELEQPQGLLPRWFTRILRDGMALTATGSYAAFADVATSALTAETHGELTRDQASYAVAAFADLTPQPDAAPAIKAAGDAGFRVFTLSNGSAATTRSFLERAGLTPMIDQVLSIDDVQAWKPDPRVYDLAIAKAGVAADSIALVAVHSWDIHGAHAVGLTTGWTPRLEGSPTGGFAGADVVGDTLVDVITALAEMPLNH